MKRIILYIYCISFVIPACSSVEYRQTGKIYSPLPDDIQVKLLLESLPEQKYEKIGIISFAGGSYDDQVEEAKEIARQKGGDGIIPRTEGTKNETKGGFSSGSFIAGADTSYVTYDNDEDSSDKQVWTFQLKAARTSNFPITISLDGLYDVTYLEDDERVLFKDEKSNDNSRLDSLHLVDVDNGKSYTYAQLKTVDLSMDNLKKRTFRWVIGEPDNSDYEPVVSKVTSDVQSKVIEAQTLSQPTSKFGLPPQ